jgi:hypothetical protein
MRVKVLEYAVAPDKPPDPAVVSGEHPAWEDPVTRIPDPTWDDVEVAIRRLDGLRYRWLHLWPTIDPADHDPDPGSHEYVEVIGGGGIYVLRVSFDDGRDHCLGFSEWPDRDVVILPDAWGFVDGLWAESARRVCRDVEVVVRAVKYYAQNGGLDPSLNWER